MTKRSREILAVILLFILVFVGMILIGAYMSTGRSWNVAATRIDDSMGSMSGYTVFVYEGARDPLESKLVEADEGEEESTADLFATRLQSATSSLSSSESMQSLLTSVVSDYRNKEAEVFAIDSSALESYAEPLVITRNGSKIGIFSVDDSTTTIGIDRVLKYFEEHEVDYVIALDNITPTDEEIAENIESTSSSSASSSATSSSSSSSKSSSSNAVKATEITVNDYLISSDSVDVVIDFQRSWYGTLGVNRSGKFLVSSPERDEIGILLVSPSGVVSAKSQGAQ